ncbi:2669_t:CDS:2 [Cetraspora pellucida]|uniref:2669_t:CDS:1 n=1 Tax=Cetraspora pellucida TaxID=1433469 RepID=A0A9N9NBP2_9GLOM|nr:2669_t:CDS:2 [Cetraspora pellucida]
MPYAVPKVLSGEKQFTQAADIYEFCVIIALELKNYCEIGYKNSSFLDCIGASKNNHGNYMQIAIKSSLQQNLVQVGNDTILYLVKYLYTASLNDNETKK